MTSIVFRNAGIIDPLSITAFGVSSKENPQAIGFFGTGLKYAIAILLREGCDLAIHSGGKSYYFAKERVQIRTDEFIFVTMNGERLGFTTELGKTWDLWAAFRELYCNCLDERGTVGEFDQTEPLKAICDLDDTVIEVRGSKFLDVWANRSSIILNRPSIHEHEGVKVCVGRTDLVFYRGVRAGKLDKQALFTYNIQRKLDLSEDRTIKWSWDVNDVLVRGWMESKDSKLIEMVLTAPEGTWEHDLSFRGVAPSDEFLEVVKHLYYNFNSSLNKSAWQACQPWLLSKLKDLPPLQLDRVEQMRLDKALAFCTRTGFSPDGLKIHVTDFLGTEILGRADGNTIYLSRRVFMMGTKMLAGTIIEEVIHLRHHCHDMTREMQNILIDSICSLGEQLVGEPL